MSLLRVFALLQQSMVDPAGPQAARIANLGWLLLWVCGAVWVVVAAFLVGGLYRKREHASAEPNLPRAVGGSTALTVVILLGLLVASVITGRALSTIPASNAMNVEITGHQWWWEVEYPDFPPYQRVRTANEIHIPVGRPVRIKVTSQDVIHSFWAPNLHGKIDLIPGHLNVTWLQADRPGDYRGQCAEFCGFQHAHMAFHVIAESPAEFNAWLDRQRQTAAMPQSPDERKGQEVFLSTACIVCHAIRGTDAHGAIAPDLTHVASRRMIAAGTLPNDRDHLSQWILDSQRIKPGNRMPPMKLQSEQLEPLLSYLQILK